MREKSREKQSKFHSTIKRHVLVINRYKRESSLNDQISFFLNHSITGFLDSSKRFSNLNIRKSRLHKVFYINTFSLFFKNFVCEFFNSDTRVESIHPSASDLWGLQVMYL